MKILHVVSSYLPAYRHGGPIWSVHNLNKWLVKKGVDVTVYTTNASLKKESDLLLGKEVKIDGVKVIYFPSYGYIHFTFSSAIFFALKKNIKNFDVIHTTGLWNFPIWAAAFWAKRHGKPYIISPRGSLMEIPLTKRSFLKKIHLTLLSKNILRKAALIHFTMEEEKEDYFSAEYPFFKTAVIFNGIDMDTSDVQRLNFRKKFNIPEKKKIVLFLGRLTWIKGFDTLIPAFAKVIKKESRAVLVLAGPNDEDYKKEIEKLIEKYEIDRNKIIFTGMILGDDKISVLQDSDVFVLPSYSENFGMAVIEAMYFRLPVVITKNVGVASYIEHGKAGLVVEKNVEEIATAIMQILDNKKFAQEIGEKGRNVVEDKFTMPKIAEKWIKAYNELT